MRIYDLIAKKRDGGTHSREELEAIVNGFVRGEVADYQMAAWMMAVYLCGRRRRVPQRPCLWRREARGSPLVYALVTKDGGAVLRMDVPA